MSLSGIDIASYQSGMNTGTIPGDFVIAKSTQGTEYTNPTWQRQIDAAIAAGKKVGIYHYSNGSGIQGEVDHFLRTIQNMIGKAILCLDWEHIPGAGENPQFYNPTYAKQFMDEVKRRTGVTMFLYGSKDSCCNAMDWSKVAPTYPLWGAQYGSNAPIYGYQENPWQSARPWGAWGKLPTIHQYTSNLRLSGWNAALDGNIAYTTREEWDNYASGKAKPDPAPSPLLTVPEIIYGVKTKAGILPDVCRGLPAGNNSEIVGIKIGVDVGSLKYRAHCGGRWLPIVTGCDWDDYVNGYAGDDRTAIDAVQIYYYSDRSRTGVYEAAYSAKPIGYGYLPEVYDTNWDTSDGNKTAGIFGKPIGQIIINLKKL